MYNYVYKSENGGQNERDSQSKNERADLVYGGDICNEVGISNCTVAMRSISPEHKRKLLFGSKGAAEK